MHFAVYDADPGRDDEVGSGCLMAGSAWGQCIVKINYHGKCAGSINVLISQE